MNLKLDSNNKCWIVNLEPNSKHYGWNEKEGLYKVYGKKNPYVTIKGVKYYLKDLKQVEDKPTYVISMVNREFIKTVKEFLSCFSL